MTIKTIDLYEYFGIEKQSNANGLLTVMIHEQYLEYCEDRRRPAMLVIPGGGYQFVSPREGESIACKYFSEGYNSFTLEYSVSPIGYPVQLLEAVMAMVYIRENAKELFIDKDHVSAVGFSAGGHLCSMLGTIWAEKEIRDILGDKVDLARPDAVILSYPVITLGELTHQGTSDVLTKKDQDLIKRLSTQNRVDKDSSPAFIWTTVNDACVPMENSMMMASAYKKAGVPFELHVFENGIHGLSLATKEISRAGDDPYIVNEPVAKWVKLSLTWLKNRGFIIKHKDEI